MMGRGHSLSGAAIFLGGSAAYSLSTGEPVHPAFLVMGTSVVAGASLLPDLDSFTATVTKSFGFFGRILYYLTNSLSMAVYTITKTSRDENKENGHRTFTHTLIGSILFGLLSLGLTSVPGSVDIFSQDTPLAEVFGLLIMAFLLHLATAGLFAPQIKKAKSKLGLLAPYILMVFSVLTTILVFFMLPEHTVNYQWLAAGVTGGMIIHILGDTITKMGTPLLWPIKIRGKRWYDVSLPAFLRITAGGTVENAILIPIFILVSVAGIVLHVLINTGVLS